MSDLGDLDATAQAELVRTGEASPSELVDAAIQRIEAVNPELNAVIIPMFEKAREAAATALPDGPFRGVPILLKDLDGALGGAPYHKGMKALKDAGYVAPHDDTNIARLKEAGFVVCGKTNTPELGLLPTTEPEIYGPTRNPWDTTRSSSGSSGGSAAAVASGMVPVATAGDGGGSIRTPAAFCGLFGLKPTRDRVPMGPDVGEGWAGLGVRGAVTRTVRDSAAVLDVLGAPEPGAPRHAPPLSRPLAEEVGADPGKLRIGVRTSVPTGSAELTPEAADAVASVAALLSDLGHTVEESSPEALDDDTLVGQFFPAFGSWVAREVDAAGEALGRTLGPDDMEPGTWVLVEMGRATPGPQYLAAIEWLHGWARRVQSWWSGGFDLLLTPTVPEPPIPLGQLASTPDNPLAASMRAAELVPFTIPFNITGQPAASIPLHWTDDGLPVGTQLVATFGREDLLVRVASQLEEARPWANRRPPVSAT